MADEKKIIEAPKLPNTIRGDGRYEMSLLKSFLEQAAMQINLANGFSAEEIKPGSDSKVPTPRNLFITFNRLGAVVTWSHLTDVSNLAYYELRENERVGSPTGLLVRTLENEVINKVPYSYQGRIYLYAVSKDKEHSNATYVNYTKSRPNEPDDISLTKNNEGTLITFLEIPTNCMGANIYVDGEKFVTLDNVFLYKHADNKIIKRVEIAYYDIFGEGERGVINCVVPDVTGLIVERNGANLDFYWNSVDIYGVTYVVRIGMEPNWSTAIEVFTTKLNKHRFVYPNPGDYYFLIKAVDSHGNISENATYISTANAPDITRNIILNFKQDDVGYSGEKINMYYDVASSGLKLEADALYGEYIINVDLPQIYRARNWLNANVIGITKTSLRCIDWTFAINSEMAKRITCIGEPARLNSLKFIKQIALYRGIDTTRYIDLIKLDNTLATIKNKAPTLSDNSDTFLQCRYDLGLKVADLTRLEYSFTDIPSVFSLTFSLKKTERLNDCYIMTLADGASFLLLGYDKHNDCFYLVGSDGIRIEIHLATTERDWITFGISQSRNNRTLFVHSFGSDRIVSESYDALPVGSFTKVYCYPKIIS